jgi:ADP-ribosyl-[dinitrogen reductase] hydrolase
LLAEGWNFERAAQLAYERARPEQRISGGCLPRVLPPGLLHYHDDLHLIGESRVVCGLTHQAELAKLSCVAFNLALQHMLLVGIGGLIEELLVWIEPRSLELFGWLVDVPRLRPERLDCGGSAPATVQAALWTALYVTDFEEGALILLSRGAAAPLVCAVGCALLGARFGAGAIPRRWLERLELRNSLERQAQRMFLLSQQVSLPVRPGDEPLSANPRLLPPER